MRYMSFFYTTKQYVDETKTETSRKGWDFAVPGFKFMGVEKGGMGLKKGEKIKKLGPSVVVKIEKIKCSPEYYGGDHVVAEGFSGMSPSEFVNNILIKKCKCRFNQKLNRITFKHIKEY